MNEGTNIGHYSPKRFNKATLLHNSPTGSDDWAFSRQHGIGGSEVSTILGLNEYKSAYTLWAERTGLVETEPVSNWSVRFGSKFELPILEMWAEDNPEWSVFLTGTYSGEVPYMQASPDAIAKNRETGEWIVIEVKTARYGWTDVPPGYEAQLTHYLDVMGCKRGVIVAVAGWNWFEKWIELSDWQAQSQRTALARFWEYMKTGTAPDYDGSDSTYETVRKQHPDIDPELSVEIEGLHYLTNAQEQFDLAKAAFNEAKTNVLAAMGNAQSAYIEHEGERITVATRRARNDGVPFLVVKKK